MRQKRARDNNYIVYCCTAITHSLLPPLPTTADATLPPLHEHEYLKKVDIIMVRLWKKKWMMKTSHDKTLGAGKF